MKNVKSLPVPYEANKKAWMLGNFFVKWLRDIDKKMKREKKNIMFIIIMVIILATLLYCYIMVGPLDNVITEPYSVF